MSLLSKSISSKFLVAGSGCDDTSPKLISWKDQKSPPIYGMPRTAPNLRSFQKNWAALSSTLRERTLRRRMAITESERSDTDWGFMTSENESVGGKSLNMREVDEETVEAISKPFTDFTDNKSVISEFLDDGSEKTVQRASISDRSEEEILPDYRKDISYDHGLNNYSINDRKDSGFQSMIESSMIGLTREASPVDIYSKKIQHTGDGFYRQIMSSDEITDDEIQRRKTRRVFDNGGVYRQEMTADERITDAEESAFCKAIDECFDAISYQTTSLSEFSDHTYEDIPVRNIRRKDDDDLIELCRLAVEILSHKEVPTRPYDYGCSQSEYGVPNKRDCSSIQCRQNCKSRYSSTDESTDSLPPAQMCQSRKRIFEDIASSRNGNSIPHKPISVSQGICKSRTEIFEALSRNSGYNTRSDSSSTDIDENFFFSCKEVGVHQQFYRPPPAPPSLDDESLYHIPRGDAQSNDDNHSSCDESISLPSVSSNQSLTFTEIFGNHRSSNEVLKLADDGDDCSSTDDGFYNVPKNVPVYDERDVAASSVTSRPKRRVAFLDEVYLFEVETEHTGGDGFKKKEKRKEEKQKSLRFEELPVVKDFNWSDLSDEMKSDLESEHDPPSSGEDSCSCSYSSLELQSTSFLMRIINSVTRCRCLGVGSDYDRLSVRDKIRLRKNGRKRHESEDSGISRSSSESSLEKLAIDWYGSQESTIDIDRTLSILEEKAKQCEEKLIKQLAKSLSDTDSEKTVKEVEPEDSNYERFYREVKVKEKWIHEVEKGEEEAVYDVINDVDLEKEMSHWRDGESPMGDSPPDSSSPMSHDDGKHSLLQFAMQHFRQVPGDRVGQPEDLDKKKKSKKPKEPGADWTWKQQVDMVKFSKAPIGASLLRLDSNDMSKLAVECFHAIMRYMGDLPMGKNQSEVDCVYTLLMNCHKHAPLRDEVCCQLMKQTTNNKSQRPDSCQRGWRLLCIVAAYFDCSQTLQPYLLKYLESAAYDKRRAYHGTALVCLQNLRKTIRYGGRKNVPSIEEITALTAGRNAKRQIYQLPGGTERIINTKSTTVVQDIIEEICSELNVRTVEEMEEFSLYCIVEGDTFTMPLAREEYILDVTTELHKNQQVFYLIFCRSVWHHPLRLDNPLYIEVAFNQIAPDYLEGLLLVMPGETLSQETVYDIAKIAALLHRASGLEHVPNMKETKFLLPKPALAVRDIKPPQWVSLVQSSWKEVDLLKPVQSKAQVLEILQRWPLFGSSFFAVKRVAEPGERAEHILALNRRGVHFLDVITHETLIHYPFSEVISTRKVKSEDGALFLDMKCGNLMQQRITRIQTDQAHEISRLIRQYITIEQRQQSEKTKKT